MLPFLVESYGETSRQRYVVSKVADEAERPRPHFVPGVELLRWNAVPMDRAVELQAEQETGGRPDTRRARALESLTSRALQYGPPPAEDWVIVGYGDLDGVVREALRLAGREPRRARTAGRPRARSPGYAIDPAAEVTRRVKKLLFAPSLVRGTAPSRRPRAGSGHRSLRQSASGSRPTSRTRSRPLVRTRSGTFGYLRLWSFDVADDVVYVEEVAGCCRCCPSGG